jgi:hypothetical protein
MFQLEPNPFEQSMELWVLLELFFGIDEANVRQVICKTVV